jgi:hypothetical protein
MAKNKNQFQQQQNQLQRQSSQTPIREATPSPPSPPTQPTDTTTTEGTNFLTFTEQPIPQTESEQAEEETVIPAEQAEAEQAEAEEAKAEEVEAEEAEAEEAEAEEAVIQAEKDTQSPLDPRRGTFDTSKITYTLTQTSGLKPKPIRPAELKIPETVFEQSDHEEYLQNLDDIQPLTEEINITKDEIYNIIFNIANEQKIHVKSAHHLMCCTLQAGGTNNNKNSNIKIKINTLDDGPFEIDSQTINKYIQLHSNNHTPRQIATHIRHKT